MSEAAVEPQELALRSARKDGRELVRMRYVEVSKAAAPEPSRIIIP